MKKNNEIDLMMKHVDLIKRIGYENLLSLNEGEKAYLMATLDLEQKVATLQKIAERMGV